MIYIDFKKNYKVRAASIKNIGRLEKEDCYNSYFWIRMFHDDPECAILFQQSARIKQIDKIKKKIFF